MKEKIFFWIFVVLLFSVMLMFICSAAKAEICYHYEVAGGMVSEIEECRIVINEELPTMRGMVDSLNEQLAMIEEKTNLLQKGLDKANEKIVKQEAECDKRVKEEVEKVTPTFTQKVQKAGTWVAVGAIFVTVLKLFL